MNYAIGQVLATCALVVLFYVITLYVIALIRRNYSLIDHGWGLGILLAVIVPLLLHEQIQLRQVIVSILIATWAMRLGTHILLRGWGRGEDQRYASWRERWGEYGWFFAFFQIFVLQGMFMFVIALPAIFINTLTGPTLGWLDVFGVLVWLFGFVWETLSDYQLERFKQNPANKGHVLTTGLWCYSRHPNYFGETLQWWGIWLLALAVSGGWLTIVSPLLITFLLLKVSGIPLLENHLRQNPEFREYVRRTPAFIPRLFRKR